MSLPMIAEVEVNWPPVTCMPSPESPAKRIVTASSSSIGSFVLVIGSSNVVADITNSILLFFGCEHHSLQGCVSRPPGPALIAHLHLRSIFAVTTGLFVREAPLGCARDGRARDI